MSAKLINSFEMSEQSLTHYIKFTDPLNQINQPLRGSRTPG